MVHEFMERVFDGSSAPLLAPLVTSSELSEQGAKNYAG